MVVSDQAADQAALNDDLMPDLAKDRHRSHGRDGGGQPRRILDDRLGRPAGGGAVQGGRCAVGDPAAPRERLLPVPGVGDVSAVLPAPLAERLPGHDRGRPRPDPPAVQPGAQRAGGRHDRDPGWDRRQPPREPGRLRPRRTRVLHHVARLPPQADRRNDVLLPRGAGSDRSVVRGHPPLRHCGKGRRART